MERLYDEWLARIMKAGSAKSKSPQRRGQLNATPPQPIVFQIIESPPNQASTAARIGKRGKRAQMGAINEHQQSLVPQAIEAGAEYSPSRSSNSSSSKRKKRKSSKKKKAKKVSTMKLRQLEEQNLSPPAHRKLRHKEEVKKEQIQNGGSPSKQASGTLPKKKIIKSPQNSPRKKKLKKIVTEPTQKTTEVRIEEIDDDLPEDFIEKEARKASLKQEDQVLSFSLKEDKQLGLVNIQLPQSQQRWQEKREEMSPGGQLNWQAPTEESPYKADEGSPWVQSRMMEPVPEEENKFDETANLDMSQDVLLDNDAVLPSMMDSIVQRAEDAALVTPVTQTKPFTQIGGVPLTKIEIESEELEIANTPENYWEGKAALPSHPTSTSKDELKVEDITPSYDLNPSAPSDVMTPQVPDTSTAYYHHRQHLRQLTQIHQGKLEIEPETDEQRLIQAEIHQTLHNTPKNQDIFPLQNIERLTGSDHRRSDSEDDDRSRSRRSSQANEEPVNYIQETQTSHAIVEESKESSSQIVSGAMDIEAHQTSSESPNPEVAIMEVNKHITDLPLSQSSALLRDHYISRSMASEPTQPAQFILQQPSRQPQILLKLQKLLRKALRIEQPAARIESTTQEELTELQKASGAPRALEDYSPEKRRVQRQGTAHINMVSEPSSEVNEVSAEIQIDQDIDQSDEEPMLDPLNSLARIRSRDQNLEEAEDDWFELEIAQDAMRSMTVAEQDLFHYAMVSEQVKMAKEELKRQNTIAVVPRFSMQKTIEGIIDSFGLTQEQQSEVVQMAIQIDLAHSVTIQQSPSRMGAQDTPETHPKSKDDSPVECHQPVQRVSLETAPRDREIELGSSPPSIMGRSMPNIEVLPSMPLSKNITRYEKQSQEPSEEKVSLKHDSGEATGDQSRILLLKGLEEQHKNALLPWNTQKIPSPKKELIKSETAQPQKEEVATPQLLALTTQENVFLLTPEKPNPDPHFQLVESARKAALEGESAKKLSEDCQAAFKTPTPGSPGLAENREIFVPTTPIREEEPCTPISDEDSADEIKPEPEIVQRRLGVKRRTSVRQSWQSEQVRKEPGPRRMLSRHPSQELAKAIDNEELSMHDGSEDRNIVIKISKLAEKPASHSGSSTEEVQYFQDSRIFRENEARGGMRLSDDQEDHLLAPESPALLELSSVSDAFRNENNKEINIIQLDDFSNWRHSDEEIEVNMSSPLDQCKPTAQLTLKGSDDEEDDAQKLSSESSMKVEMIAMAKQVTSPLMIREKTITDSEGSHEKRNKEDGEGSPIMYSHSINVQLRDNQLLILPEEIIQKPADFNGELSHELLDEQEEEPQQPRKKQFLKKNQSQAQLPNALLVSQAATKVPISKAKTKKKAKIKWNKVKRNLKDIAIMKSSVTSLKSAKVSPKEGIFAKIGKTLKKTFMIDRPHRPSLQNGLDAMEFSSEIKANEERIKYLWEVARKHARKIKMIAMLRRCHNEAQQERQDGEKIQPEKLPIHYLEEAGHEEWACLIKLNSPFLKIWDIIISLMLIYYLYTIPFSIGSHYLDLYIRYVGTSKISFITTAVLLLIDIVINFIAEHQIGELKQTTTIKESTKAYLTHWFFFDIVSVIFIVILAFSTEEYFLTHFWDHLQNSFFTRLDPELTPDEAEILDRFRQFSPEAHNATSDSFTYTMGKVASSMSRWDNYSLHFIWISYPFVLFKFVNLSRTRSILNYIENFFQSTGAYVQFSQLQKFVVFMRLTFIMLKLSFIIHVISSVWMYNSESVMTRLASHILVYLNDVMDGVSEEKQSLLKMKDGLFEEQTKAFYLIALTLTVIGYGDSYSMPNFADYAQDYKVLLLCMLMGFLAFQQANAQLNSYLLSLASKQEISTKNQLEDTKEKLDGYFLHHNQMRGPRHFTMKEIDNWKRRVDYNFVSSYHLIIQDQFYLQLNPNLKNKLIAIVIQRESHWFEHFFYDNHIQMMPSRIIFQIMTQIENEEIVLQDEPNAQQSRMIVETGKEIEFLYLIKRGGVMVFDKHFHYLYNLERGGFFGEYHIAFGLVSELYFRASSCSKYGVCQLFKVDKTALMKILCSDFQSFYHFQNLAIQKYRYNKKIIKKVQEIPLRLRYFLKREFKLTQQSNQSDLPQVSPPKKSVPLYDVQEYMSWKYSRYNPNILNYYKDLKEQRMIKLIRTINSKILMEEQEKILKTHAQYLRLMGDSIDLSSKKGNGTSEALSRSKDLKVRSPIQTMSMKLKHKSLRMAKSSMGLNRVLEEKLEGISEEERSLHESSPSLNGNMTINDIKLLGLEDSSNESKADFSSPEKNRTMRSSSSENSPRSHLSKQSSKKEPEQSPELPKYSLRIAGQNMSDVELPQLQINKSSPVKTKTKRLSEFTDTQKKENEERKSEDESSHQGSASQSRGEEKSAISSIKVGEEEIEGIMNNEDFDYEIDSDDEVDLNQVIGLHNQTFSMEHIQRQATLEQIFQTMEFEQKMQAWQIEFKIRLERALMILKTCNRDTVVDVMNSRRVRIKTMQVKSFNTAFKHVLDHKITQIKKQITMAQNQKDSPLFRRRKSFVHTSVDLRKIMMLNVPPIAEEHNLRGSRDDHERFTSESYNIYKRKSLDSSISKQSDSSNIGQYILGEMSSDSSN